MPQNPSRRPRDLPGRESWERTPEERNPAVAPDRDRVPYYQELAQYMIDPALVAEMNREVSRPVRDNTIRPITTGYRNQLSPIAPPRFLHFDEVSTFAADASVARTVDAARHANEPRNVIVTACEHMIREAYDRNLMKLVTRDEVGTRMWQMSEDRRKEYVEYITHHLRRKLTDHAGAELVKKCDVQYRDDYNSGGVEATTEAVVFTRAEFETFMRTVSTAIAEACKAKGYIK